MTDCMSNFWWWRIFEEWRCGSESAATAAGKIEERSFVA
jgi:hypothetical protein